MEVAVHRYRAIREAVQLAQVEARAMAALAERGWKPDYISVRKRGDLQAPDAADLTTEYIGRLVVPIPEPGTWFGVTHKSGMTGNLILMAWPSGEDVVTDFRYAPATRLLRDTLETPP